MCVFIECMYVYMYECMYCMYVYMYYCMYVCIYCIFYLIKHAPLQRSNTTCYNYLQFTVYNFQFETIHQ